MTYEEIIEQEPQPIVYSIDFPNGMFYVGRTVDVSRRAKRHFHESMRSAHSNTAMERCFKKYKFQETWGVIKTFGAAKEAVDFEAMYIEEFWDDPLFLNQKRGDKFTALENERQHSKLAYYMNAYTKMMWRSEKKGELRHQMGQKGYQPLPSGIGGKCHRVLAYGSTPEECEADAERILRRDFLRICKKIDPVRSKRYIATNQKYNAIRKEQRRKNWLKKSYVVKDLKSGRVFVQRRSKLTSEQTNVLEKGVRPWSNYNVRKYGEDWADFVPGKMGNEPKPIIGVHKSGEIGEWASLGAFAREELNAKTKSRKNALRKQAADTIKRNGTCHGWELKYKKQ